jgi:hypothetical protein
MTRQLSAPIKRLSLTPTNRMATDLFHQVEIYRLVNSGGTAHTAEELARAAKVENR